MAIKDQYLNNWRRHNKNLRKNIKIQDIELVEYEHSIITKQMEEDLAFLEDKFVTYAKQKDAKNKWNMIKELQYRIIVRPGEDNKYILVSGRLQYEFLKRMNITRANIYVADVSSREDFYNKLRRELVIKTMLPVKAVVKPAKAVSEDEINAAMMYLMKNKDFEHEMVVDPFTYKIIKEPVNLYVAERIGLVDIKATLCGKDN